MARIRRIFNAEFKAKVVLEIISGSKNMAEACREYSLKADLLSHWKSQFLGNASKVFESASEADPQQARIAELERLAGKQSLELEILHLPWRAVPGKKALTLLPQASQKGES